MELVKKFPAIISVGRFVIGDLVLDLLSFRLFSLVQKLLFIIFALRGGTELDQRVVTSNIAGLDWNFTCSVFSFSIYAMRQGINKRNLVHFVLLILSLSNKTRPEAAPGYLPRSPRPLTKDKKQAGGLSAQSILISVLAAGLLAKLYYKLFQR